MVKPANLRRVVIIGGGFGGLETAQRLKRADVSVTLIDRQNYHLFQPLLYQVATGGLSPANIATPLRLIVRRQKNCEVIMEEVTGFDIAGSKVILDSGELPFDVLIVAAGATHSYFGNDQWEQFAPGLKTVPDALEIRRRVYVAFEEAERTRDLDLQCELMTMVVVGGGPTGVELAGALAEIADHTLKHEFRHIQPEKARIVIVEAAPHLLAHYPPELCERAQKKVRELGIEIRLHTKVTDLDSESVTLSGPDGEEQIRTRTVLWGAGVKASPLGTSLTSACGIDPERGGRIPVTPTLNVAGYDNVFAIGDIASCLGDDDKPLPGIAPVAMQQGKYVADAIMGKTTGPFSYVDRGTMATIGRAKAVAKIGKWEFCGLFAWLLWLFIHLLLIVQFQNRLLILLQWTWNYATFNRSARIITGGKNSEAG